MGKRGWVFHQQLPRGWLEYQEDPGTQQGLILVWNRSAPFWDWRHQPCQPGEVTVEKERWHLQTSPGDQCQPPRQKNMSHQWEGKRSDGGTMERLGRHHARRVPAQRVPVKNAHHNSRKQSERKKEDGQLVQLLHGSSDHPLLRLHVVLIGVLTLFGPAVGGRSTAVSLPLVRSTSPKPRPKP